MDPLPTTWQETTIDGSRTRRWSLDAKQCPDLSTNHIGWLGIDTVYAPYRRVRLAPSGSFFLACLEGEGRVLLEGEVPSAPAAEKAMVRSMLSESLQAVVSQALLKKVGGGRVAAHEIMIGTSAIRNLIREDKIAQMYSAIQTGAQLGMQTLDQCLKTLIQKGVVSREEAKLKAKAPDTL